MKYETLKIRKDNLSCYIQFYRPGANNSINDRLSAEFEHTLAMCKAEDVKIIVLEGLPDVFLFGADFKELHDKLASGRFEDIDPEPGYELLKTLATGPFITVSHVRGRVNAGGIGFVAASDIVVADRTAVFSLSEMLFGLLPAIVMPFLIRRVGFQRAKYLTLMTKPVSVDEAHAWGLVDAVDHDSESLLRKHLLRLTRLPPTGVKRYKAYIGKLEPLIYKAKPFAMEAFREVFSDPINLEAISRFVESGFVPHKD
jgi:polyketide biosynthesis enoyl-CoA hydratase PksH